MKRYLKYLLFLFVLVNSVTVARAEVPVESSTTQPTEPAPMVIKIKGFEGVIFPEEAALFKFSDRISGFWTPTQVDIAKAEDALRSYLQKKDPKLLQALNGYKRQYVGHLMPEGRVVYMNFFPANFSASWHSSPVVVKDGGRSFFHAVYNVKRNKITEFQTNGEG